MKHNRFRDEFIEDFEDTPDPLAEVLNTLFDRPEVQNIFQKVGGILDKASQYVENPAASFARAARTARAQAARPRVPREDPRVVLGFKPDEKITADQVRDRKRDLAKKHHPDLPGGSVEKMAKINAAADELLASLK